MTTRLNNVSSQFMEYQDIDRNEAVSTNDNRTYTQGQYLRMMNDDKQRKDFENARLQWQDEGTTFRRVFEREDWSTFIGPVYLDGILENTEYRSTASQLATTTTAPAGLQFIYREFENFQRAQRGGENTEFERRKGQRVLQEVPFYTNGLRSYVTEEEQLDIPVDSMRLEMNTMGASIALERDLLWMHSLYGATSGTNATTYNNLLQASSEVGVNDLHLVLSWFTSPFAGSTDNITVENPFADGTAAVEVEGLMRLGKFRATDVLVSPSQYWNIISNTTLQQQNIWTNSKILDTGELQVPLLGVNIHKTNMGYFTDANDPDSWLATDDVILIDRRMGGGGTIGVRQPLQIRNWQTPQFRTTDFMIFERLGFAVQNRRALVRVNIGS